MKKLDIALISSRRGIKVFLAVLLPDEFHKKKGFKINFIKRNDFIFQKFKKHFEETGSDFEREMLTHTTEEGHIYDLNREKISFKAFNKTFEYFVHIIDSI